MKNSGKTIIKFAMTLILPVLIILTLPFELSQDQALTLAGVILVVSWWASKIIHMSISALFLIAFFFLFTDTPALQILRFPLSNIFLLLIAATLLCEGITRSGLSARISHAILYRFGYTGLRLIALPFLIDFVLIFFIPQPFPRIILLSAIYLQFLKPLSLKKETISVIMFSIFVAATGTSMAFLSGDIVLNNLVMEFADISLTWIEWAIYMAIPSIIICLLLFLGYVLVFGREVKDLQIKKSASPKSSPMTSKEKKSLYILIMVTGLWITEPLHGLDTAYAGLLGVFLMFLTQLISFKDFKAVNLHLIIFLTAAFAIGETLTHTGAAQGIFSHLLEFMPKDESFLYLPFLLLIVMGLHMVIGSSVTTLAVALPGIMMIGGNNIHPVALTMMVYTATNLHYLIPFHHVTIMIGEREGYYENRHVLRLGLLLTVLVFIAIYLVQIPWWNLIGLL